MKCAKIKIISLAITIIVIFTLKNGQILIYLKLNPGYVYVFMCNVFVIKLN